jgi:gluconate kinase
MRIAPIPQLLLIAGRPATGKSTLFKKLFPRLGQGWAALDVDTFSIPLIEAARAALGTPLEALYGTPWLRSMRAAQYQALMDQARQLRALGTARIALSASFTDELMDPTWLPRLQQEFGTVRVIRTWASREIVYTRLQARAGYWDAMRVHHWGQEQLRYSPIPPRGPGLVLNTEKNDVDYCVSECLVYLAARAAYEQKEVPLLPEIRTAS